MKYWNILVVGFIITGLLLVGSSIGCVVLLAMFGVGPVELAWSLGVAEERVDSFITTYVMVLLALLVVLAGTMTARERRMRDKERGEATTQVLGTCPKTSTTKKMKALQ